MDKYSYGKTPKSLQLLKQIIEADPTYAKAYYQLGVIYYYELKDYQSAGYYFKTCIAIDPTFPDVYENYMQLLAFLNMAKTLNTVKTAALSTPGVDHAEIYNIMGLFEEKVRELQQAKTYYTLAFEVALNKSQLKDAEENMARVQTKLQYKSTVRYTLAE